MGSVDVMYQAYHKVLGVLPEIENLRWDRQDGDEFLRFRVGSVEARVVIFAAPGYPSGPEQEGDPFMVSFISDVALVFYSPELTWYLVQLNRDLPLCKVLASQSDVDERLVMVSVAVQYWHTGYPLVDLQRHLRLFMGSADNLDDDLLNRFGGFRGSALADEIEEPRLYQPGELGA